MIEDIKHLLASYPRRVRGRARAAARGSRPRTPKLGAAYKVAPNAALNAELDHLLGEAMLEAAAA